MQHWTVHEKVEFPKFPADTGGGGVYSTTLATFDPELRIEVKKFSYVGWGGSIPQLLQLLILNSEMKDLH